MADSTRRTIENAIITALTNITGMALVTQDADVWNGRNTNDYPNLYISMSTTNDEWISNPAVSAADRMATMELSIQGETLSQYASTIETDLDTVEQEVQKAITENAAIEALVVDCELNTRERDQGVQDRYGIFSHGYSVIYLYNHNAP